MPASAWEPIRSTLSASSACYQSPTGPMLKRWSSPSPANSLNRPPLQVSRTTLERDRARGRSQDARLLRSNDLGHHRPGLRIVQERAVAEHGAFVGASEPRSRRTERVTRSLGRRGDQRVVGGDDDVVRVGQRQQLDALAGEKARFALDAGAM